LIPPRRAEALVGTAGWTLPREVQARFLAGESHLARYARVFPAVEINSTFHRPHRASTFARWAESVPRGFRFSLKVPKVVTHEHRLAGTRALMDEFLAQIESLGAAAACLLVQLPPSLELDARVARPFLTGLRERFEGDIALEPRHDSWFTAKAERLLVDARVARVAADPPRAANGFEPGGYDRVAYFRLHGSPRVYYSAYEEPFLESLAARIEARMQRDVRCWCIFDNTTLGAATGNALALMERLGR
jgi:uncharacterized protein YecE (DUF72 family)